MVIDFGSVITGMSFDMSVQTAVRFPHIVSVSSGTFKLIHNGALVLFWYWVFQRNEAVRVGGFPVNNKFTWGC